MNPLTLVKRTQKINSTEAALGISEDASWHAKYRDSAYVFIGGIPYELTEGDIVTVFAQCGEVVDVNLVRDKGTGKSKGFAFLAYEDQRSTVLAVDNLNGAKVAGRIVRVDHVTKYKKKEEEEDDEKRQQEREARGVCYAFQRGECNRGASCKYSHDEQRNANTGWGAQDTDTRWNNDRYDGPPRSHKNFFHNTSDKTLPGKSNEEASNYKSLDRDGRSSRSETNEKDCGSQRQQNESKLKNEERHRGERSSERRSDSRREEDRDTRTRDKHSERYRSERDQADDRDQRRDEKRLKRDGHSLPSNHQSRR